MPSDSPAKTKPAADTARPAQPESNVKETVESILVAFILAFIFRAFVVEAFVIPTGSMAPTLMGAHMRFRCPDCGYHFDVNFSTGSNSDDVVIPDEARTLNGEPITYDGGPYSSYPTLHCPNCGRDIPVTNNDDPDNDATAPPVYYGDRILVLKYLYLFQPPQRWDVVVFKAPNEKARNYSENYIKRLVGLPGETLMILDGDIYVRDPQTGDYRIQRKPYSIQKDLWRIVYDNDYLAQNQPAGMVKNPPTPRAAPWRQPWTPDGSTPGWTLNDRNGVPSRIFSFNNPAGAGTLTFDASANPDTHALTDNLAYDQNRSDFNPVSDLKLNCVYQRQAGDGPFSMELAKRNHVFTAEITRGHARLLDERDGKTIVLDSKAVSDLEGPQPAQLEFVNCDYCVWLRINGKEVFRTTDAQYSPDWKDLKETWESRPPMPQVRVLAEKQQAQIEHLSLWHDIYYLNHMGQPKLWGAPDNPISLKDSPKEYFVMGDNSPISGDARMWTDPVKLPAEMIDVAAGRVPEQFMLGKAFFVYWPAGYRPFSKKQSALPNWGIIPNFGEMRSIH